MSPDEAEGRPRPFQDPDRREKHLARTLEDVSHLFLTQENPGAGTPAPLPQEMARQTPRHSAERPNFLWEDPSRPLERDALLSLLSSNTGALEDGLRTIDTNVPMEQGSPVDLVALDRFGRLCLIDLDVSANDALLLRGICHFDWFVRNVPIVRRMYHGRVIDFSSHPRVFLVAPGFSAMFLRAAQRITCAQILTYLCRVVAGPDGTRILLAPQPRELPSSESS